MITIHPRSYYIGTSVERAALTLPADAQGAHFLDTDLGSEFFWDGTDWVEHAGGAGASTFLDLLDTPDSYADAGLFLARVNAAEDALEFSTDLPDHVHSADEGQGGILEHGGLDGLDDHDHPLYIPITGVSRLRAGVVTVYADPDDAFVAADTAGDVVLVPPGTWVLSTGHTLAAGVSMFGLGPAEACILSANLSGESYVIDLATGAGVVQNVKIVATMTRSNNGILAGLSLGPGTTARNVISIVTASGSTYTIYGAGICTNGNVWVIGCKAYVYMSGSTIEGYAYYHFGGYIFHSYGYAEKTSGASAVVAGLYMISSTTAYTFESTFEAGGSIGLRYGIYAAYGTNYVFVAFASGATYDLCILFPATLVIYSLKYNTLNNAGTLSQYGGDRAGTNRADTISGLWTFDRGAATAPFAIARADAPTVTNLDADKLDTYHAVDFAKLADLRTMLFTQAQGLLLYGPNSDIWKIGSAYYWMDSRKHPATLTGALHFAPGRWVGTRALVVEESTVNYCPYSSFKTWGGGVPTGWSVYRTPTLTQETVFTIHGKYSVKIEANLVGDAEGVEQTISGLTPGTSYRVSVWAYRVSGPGAVVLFVADSDFSNAVYVDCASYGRWERLEVSKTCAADGKIRILLYAALSGGINGVGIFDAVQVEAKSYATSFACHDMGTGYSGAENSTSTRAATEVNLDAFVARVSSNNEFSIRVVAQAPFASTAVWSTDSIPVLFCTKGTDSSNHVFIAYLCASDYLAVYINGDYWLAAGVTFAQGDWLDIVVTLDFTNDSYKLYLNGVLLDTDTQALTPPVITDMNIGTYTTGAYWWDGPIAEVALFDRVLTAAEIGGLAALQRPLIDAGATHKAALDNAYYFDLTNAAINIRTEAGLLKIT